VADPTNRADLEAYFDRFGWTCDALDETTLRTGFSGAHSSFTALVRIADHWVMFTVNPFLQPLESGWGHASLKMLAVANQATHMVKLGIDPDDDAFITVELPTEGFTYDHFKGALEALAHAADDYLLTMLQARAIDERNG